MNKSLHQYNHALANETTNKAWDQLQRSYQCCGVMNYTDWSISNGTDIEDNLPFSCCEESNTTCIPEEMYNRTQTKGCLEKMLRFDFDGMIIGILVSLIGIFIFWKVFHDWSDLKNIGYPNHFFISFLWIILIFVLMIVLVLSQLFLFCLVWYRLYMDGNKQKQSNPEKNQTGKI